jgi:hypothetical protein
MKSRAPFKEGDLVTPVTPVAIGSYKDEVELSIHSIGMVYKIFKDIANDGNYFLGIFWFNLTSLQYRNAPHPDGIYLHHWTQIKKF